MPTELLDAPPQAGPLLAYLLPPPCAAPADADVFTMPAVPTLRVTATVTDVSAAPKPFDRLCLTPRGVTVYSKSGATYEVALGRVGIPTHCSCPGWGFNEHCRHADEALRKFGWMFSRWPGAECVTDTSHGGAKRGECDGCGAALRSVYLAVPGAELFFWVCERAECGMAVAR